MTDIEHGFAAGDIDDEPPVVIERIGEDRFLVRRAGADDVADPFVAVHIFDQPEDEPRRTVVNAIGVGRYDNYAKYGAISVVGVGHESGVEIKTRVLDDDQKVTMAGKIALLSFELSEAE